MKSNEADSGSGAGAEGGGGGGAVVLLLGGFVRPVGGRDGLELLLEGVVIRLLRICDGDGTVTGACPDAGVAGAVPGPPLEFGGAGGALCGDPSMRPLGDESEPLLPSALLPPACIPPLGMPLVSGDGGGIIPDNLFCPPGLWFPNPMPGGGTSPPPTNGGPDR